MSDNKLYLEAQKRGETCANCDWKSTTISVQVQSPDSSTGTIRVWQCRQQGTADRQVFMPLHGWCRRWEGPTRLCKTCEHWREWLLNEEKRHLCQYKSFRESVTSVIEKEPNDWCVAWREKEGYEKHEP